MIHLYVLTEVLHNGWLEHPPRVFTFPFQAAEAWRERTGAPLQFPEGEVRLTFETGPSTLYLDLLEVPGRVEIPREVVEMILHRYHSSEQPSTTALARELGISQTMVSGIVRGARRRDVE